ncbi:MAG: hypothetical protein PIR53_18245 [Nocardioides alkalitolerans]
MTLTDTSAEQEAGFAERLAASLLPVFEGEEPLLLTDSRALLRMLHERGVGALHFEHLSGLSPDERRNVVAIPTTPLDVSNHDVWREYFAESRVLIVAGVAFDPAPEAVLYTLEKMARSSFVDAAERNNVLLEAVAGSSTMVVSSADAELRCELDEITMLRPKIEPELAPGEWESVGAYFEVGLVSVPDEFMTGIKPGFDVNGEFVADGVSVAVHRHVGDDVRAMQTAAWELLRSLARAGEFPLRLTVEHSVLRKVLTASGRDMAPELLVHTNAGLGGMLTELAFSSNAAMKPDEVDWSVNSQLNEGAIGVHIAVGEGLTGAHVDFIAIDATTDFRA